MKLFMMPHTVPKRPTNGAVEPMVAKTPVPRLTSRPAASSMRSRRAETRSLMAYLSATSQDARVSATAARSMAGTAPRLASMRFVASAMRVGGGELAQRIAHAPLGGPQLDTFRHPHRPGDDGGDSKADHHRLHDDVGGHEHAPRRQVAREVVGLHHGRGRGRGDRCCRGRTGGSDIVDGGRGGFCGRRCRLGGSRARGGLGRRRGRRGCCRRGRGRGDGGRNGGVVAAGAADDGAFGGADWSAAGGAVVGAGCVLS